MKKATKIILCALGSVFLLLFASLSVVSFSRSLGVGKVNSDKAYKNVMSSIENITTANPRVVDIAMLGAHDSNTYNLGKQIKVSGEVGKGIKAIYKLAPGLAYRYTKTQVSSVYDQMCQGVRYLHFKCSYYQNKWYGSHSLIDGPIEDYIKQVMTFLQEAPGEIAVLQLHFLYGKGTSVSAFLEELFNFECNGQKFEDFVPYENVPLGSLTYNDVTLNGTQGGIVIHLTLDDETANDEFFDYEESEYRLKTYQKELFNPWVNRVKTTAVIEKLDQECQTVEERYGRLINCFRVMQISTSPTAKDFFETLTMWSLISKAKKHNVKILNNSHFDCWLSHMPILMCDFSTSANGGFNRKVNDKLIEYNKNLVKSLLAKLS